MLVFVARSEVQDPFNNLNMVWSVETDEKKRNLFTSGNDTLLQSVAEGIKRLTRFQLHSLLATCISHNQSPSFRAHSPPRVARTRKRHVYVLSKVYL